MIPFVAAAVVCLEGMMEVGNLSQMSIEIVVANLLRCFRLNKAVSPKYGLRID